MNVFARTADCCLMVSVTMRIFVLEFALVVAIVYAVISAVGLKLVPLATKIVFRLNGAVWAKMSEMIRRGATKTFPYRHFSSCGGSVAKKYKRIVINRSPG